jgi:ABC-type nitrate/sulfonate/bicarbonate transport system substrate-binding protein
VELSRTGRYCGGQSCPGLLPQVFLTLFLLSWLVLGSALAAEPIRIAYSSVNPHALLAWVAEKRGLYTKYGLSSVLVYVPGGSVAIQALVSGDIDLAQLTGLPG